MIKVRITVKPGTSVNELKIMEPGNWQVKLRAKPVDGEANKALLEFLSKKLNIGKSKIRIEKGLTSRYKIVVIDGEVDGIT